MDILTRHIPILLDPITDFLTEGLLALPPSAPAGIIIDCTLGGGGHTSSILEKISKHPSLAAHCVVGMDQDPSAIERNQTRFKNEIAQGKIEVVHAPFSQALKVANGRPIYGILADLGISSDQIDSETRGFSFRFPAPLDMRMNVNTGLSLADWLAQISETELADVIWKYGEERFSRKIARKLIDLRVKNQFPKDTRELADAIASVFPPKDRHRGIHPATRTFQALRIEINQELAELETLLSKILPAVAQDCHIAILTFHSLEDRPVKHALRNSELYDLPSRKAIEASDEEVAANSRARSAKLRLAIRK